MADTRPKEVRARDRDTRRRASEFTHVAADGQLRGKSLPENVMPEGWHPATVEWWETWRASAQARRFTKVDWQFLLDTALMHHSMWAEGRLELASEIRLRVGKFGATPEDRAKMKVSVDTPDDEPSAPVDSAEQDQAQDRRRDLKIVG